VRPPVARLTTSDGASGFGWSRVTREQAEALLGQPVDSLFTADGSTEAARVIEYPLWDMAGKRAGKPVYALAAPDMAQDHPLRVPCYDTSLYVDDLHLSDDSDAAALIADEAREGMARGHRNVKVKVGRGARHMPLEEGTRRDIAVIRAVREAVGPDAALMIDANNGYNLNLTKRVLGETADCRVLWMEEAFHEDNVLYQDLKDWMDARGLDTWIADGEGQASPALLDWAREGLIDVVQYDVLSPGFTRWAALGPQLDSEGVRSAPHHYGGFFGNYTTGHLAPRIQGLTFIEWDEATVDGIAAPGYAIEEGQVTVPATPGFGLELDDATFTQAVRRVGFDVSV
jgi:L-alanine-DL-glutamate epimerase-like enolase superfamily enzyme